MDNQKITCSCCKKEVLSSEVKKTRRGYVCNECQSRHRSKRRKIVLSIICLLIVAIVAAFLIWKSLLIKGNSDEVVVNVPNIEISETPQFSFESTKAIASTRESGVVQNIQSFRQIMENNKTLAVENGTATLPIPSVCILFSLNSADLVGETAMLLDEFAKVYNQTNREAEVLVEGFGCNLGSVKGNLKVSRCRAEAVKQALVDFGMPSDKIEIHFYGKNRNEEFNYPSITDYRRVVISIK